MSAPKIAGDMAQMQNLSDQFGKAGASVQTLMADLNRITTDTIGPGWEGASAQRFLTAWSAEFKPALDKLNVALAEAGAEVSRRKQALVQADS